MSWDCTVWEMVVQSIEGTVTDNVPEEVRKVKNNIPPPLIRLSCQTFMGQTENKGRHRLLTSWLVKAVTGSGLGRVPKKKLGIVFGGSAYHWIAPRSFQKSNRLCLVLFCVWFLSVCESYNPYLLPANSNTRNTTFPLFEKNKTDSLSCRMLAAVLLTQVSSLCFHALKHL